VQNGCTTKVRIIPGCFFNRKQTLVLTTIWLLLNGRGLANCGRFCKESWRSSEPSLGLALSAFGCFRAVSGAGARTGRKGVLGSVRRTRVHGQAFTFERLSSLTYTHRRTALLDFISGQHLLGAHGFGGRSWDRPPSSEPTRKRFSNP
jgi:hypothetical protein